MTTDLFKTKVYITSKTKSKLDDRLEDRIALFSVYRHSVSGLLTFYCEKTFRDRGSGFV